MKGRKHRPMIANNLVDFAARYGFDITANSDAIYGKINDRPFTLYSGWNFTGVKTPLPWLWSNSALSQEPSEEGLPSQSAHPFAWDEETKALGPVLTLLGGESSSSPRKTPAEQAEPVSSLSGRQVLGEDQGFLLARSYYHFFLPSVRQLYTLVTAIDKALTALGIHPTACLVCGRGPEHQLLVEGLAYDNLVYLHKACQDQSLVGAHPLPARSLFQTLRPWKDA